MARKQCPPLDQRAARLAAQLRSAENDDVELKRTKAALRRSPAVLLAFLIDNDFELDDDEVFENQSAFIEMAMELSNHPGLSGLMLSYLQLPAVDAYFSIETLKTILEFKELYHRFFLYFDGLLSCFDSLEFYTTELDEYLASVAFEDPSYVSKKEKERVKVSERSKKEVVRISTNVIDGNHVVSASLTQDLNFFINAISSPNVIEYRSTWPYAALSPIWITKADFHRVTDLTFNAEAPPMSRLFESFSNFILNPFCFALVHNIPFSPGPFSTNLAESVHLSHGLRSITRDSLPATVKIEGNRPKAEVAAAMVIISFLFEHQRQAFSPLVEVLYDREGTDARIRAVNKSQVTIWDYEFYRNMMKDFSSLIDTRIYAYHDAQPVLSPKIKLPSTTFLYSRFQMQFGDDGSIMMLARGEKAGEGDWVELSQSYLKKKSSSYGKRSDTAGSTAPALSLPAIDSSKSNVDPSPGGLAQNSIHVDRNIGDDIVLEATSPQKSEKRKGKGKEMKVGTIEIMESSDDEIIILKPASPPSRSKSSSVTAPLRSSHSARSRAADQSKAFTPPLIPSSVSASPRPWVFAPTPVGPVVVSPQPSPATTASAADKHFITATPNDSQATLLSPDLPTSAKPTTPIEVTSTFGASTTAIKSTSQPVNSAVVPKIRFFSSSMRQSQPSASIATPTSPVNQPLTLSDGVVSSDRMEEDDVLASSTRLKNNWSSEKFSTILNILGEEGGVAGDDVSLVAEAALVLAISEAVEGEADLEANDLACILDITLAGFLPEAMDSPIEAESGSGVDIGHDSAILLDKNLGTNREVAVKHFDPPLHPKDVVAVASVVENTVGKEKEDAEVEVAESKEDEKPRAEEVEKDETPQIEYGDEEEGESPIPLTRSSGRSHKRLHWTAQGQQYESSGVVIVQNS